ncbi:MAG: methyltransferase domain-containing protein [Nitrospirae bacterium]|nr:methyltransferase domain-containing protein [Nitrospirota bacterium]MCL5976702.1 methyltransferase domain-containing protein [Nitrospirota bacterium]
MNNKKYFYDKFAEEFDGEMNKYDLNKRLSIVFEKLLSPKEIAGKKFLDIGCGTGWFSRKAAQEGAYVFSMDIGTNLLRKVSEKCETQKAVSDAVSLGVKDRSFDYILATEVIEHTPNPKGALAEMHRVLNDNGILIMTVPNRVWHFTIHIARILNIRRYDGYENWVGYYQLQKWFEDLGFEVEEVFGFHFFPFVFQSLNPLLDKLDSFAHFYSPLMLNIAARCRKIN